MFTKSSFIVMCLSAVAMGSSTTAKLEKALQNGSLAQTRANISRPALGNFAQIKAGSGAFDVEEVTVGEEITIQAPNSGADEAHDCDPNTGDCTVDRAAKRAASQAANQAARQAARQAANASSDDRPKVCGEQNAQTCALSTCKVVDDRPLVKGDIYAETASTVQSTNHTCFTAAERNLAPLDDFWTNYRGSTQYSDSEFTPDASSLHWTNISHGDGSTGSEGARWSGIQWQRAGDVFADHSLYGTNGVTPEDVRQGSIGDCWFLSAISALSEVPGRIERIFHNPDNVLSPNGIYAVKFWTLGVPHTVIVDDYLPMTESWGSYYTTFSHMGIDSAVWAPIMEKAFAKYHGNYGHIVGGDSRMAARTLSGAPYTTYAHQSLSQDELWDHLHDADGNDKIIQVNTNGSNNAYTDHQGLVNGHAYTVLGCVELNSGEKLVKMRNPWASELYTGAWCDDCSEWDETSKVTAGWVDADDGVFFMPLNNFKSTFDYTHVTEDVGDWHEDHFLMLNDQYHDSDPGTQDWICGSSCTTHTLVVSSDVTQDVFVTAHTWDKRCQANTQHCVDIYNGMKSHFIKAPHDAYHRTFRYGSMQLDPFKLEAGEEMEIVLEFDWSNSELANDWSMTIWGQDGVHIRHKKGYLTDTHDMPLTGDEPSSNDTTDVTDNTEDTTPVDDTTDVTDNTEDTTPVDDTTDVTDNTDVTDDTNNNDVTDDTNNNDVTDDVTDDTNNNDSNDTTDNTDDTNNDDTNNDDTEVDCVHFQRCPYDPEGFEWGNACPLGSGDTSCGWWYRYNGGERFWTTCANWSAELDEYLENLTADDTVQDEDIVDDTTDDTIVMPDLGPQYWDFINWVDEYEPHINFGGCGVGLIEDYTWTDDWEIQYQTVMKNECDNWLFEITIWMATEEWDRLEEIYTTYTDDGSIENESVISNCEVDDWGYIETTKCTFLVGSIPKYEDEGMNHGEQRTAGWRNAAGDYGIRNYRYKWTEV